MPAVVDSLWRAPVKGTRMDRVGSIAIDTVLGVRDDRQYGIRRKPGEYKTWAPKAAFYVCMNEGRMAAELPVFNDGNQSGRLDTHYLQSLAERLNVQEPLQVQFAANEFSLHDTKGAYVSFINLATVRALSEHMNHSVDPQRFRMNVWMTGLKPFEELEWVNGFPGTREIMVGKHRFRVDDACERCKAIEANIVTGRYDLNLRDAIGDLMTSRGYKSPHRGTPVVMGILAAPLQSGLVKVGDEVRLA